MDANEISILMEKNRVLRDSARGVYARDNLPSNECLLPGCYVINTSKASSPGSHWTSLWKAEADPYVVQFFDSLGRAPSYYDIHFPNHNRILFNDVKVQSDTSSKCAAFCLYHLYWSASGANLSEIVSSFTNNFMRNDTMVDYFVQQAFR